jgi:hypothetical protein
MQSGTVITAVQCIVSVKCGHFWFIRKGDPIMARVFGAYPLLAWR